MSAPLHKLDGSDWLYVTGAVFVVAGVGLRSLSAALMAAGGFCLVFPLLHLASSFIRGLK